MAALTVGRVGSTTMAASHRLPTAAAAVETAVATAAIRRRSHASSGAARADASLATAAASCTARRWRVRLPCTRTRSAQARAVAPRAARPIATRAVPSARAAGSARPAATTCCAVHASTRTALQELERLRLSMRQAAQHAARRAKRKSAGGGGSAAAGGSEAVGGGDGAVVARCSARLCVHGVRCTAAQCRLHSAFYEVHRSPAEDAAATLETATLEALSLTAASPHEDEPPTSKLSRGERRRIGRQKAALYKAGLVQFC